MSSEEQITSSGDAKSVEILDHIFHVQYSLDTKWVGLKFQYRSGLVWISSSEWRDIKAKIRGLRRQAGVNDLDEPGPNRKLCVSNPPDEALIQTGEGNHD